MSVRKTRDIRNALLRKGFQLDKTHHEMYWLYHGAKKTSVHTYLSHSISEYGRELLGNVRQQMKLTARVEFDRFMDCPMDGTEYRELLIQRGHIGN